MPDLPPVKPWHETTEAVAALLDTSMKAAKDAEPPRTYLGASMLGAECARAVAYQWHGVPKDPGRGFSGRVYRIFDFGHRLEDAMAEYLRRAGFCLRTHDVDGEQYGFEAAGRRIQGHIDGVFTSGPDVPGLFWPALWEAKSINAKGFAQLVDKGVRKSKPLYYAQTQILMGYMELDVCLFTALNKDTSDVFAEVIPLDVQYAQELSDRAVKIVQSASADEFPRIARDGTDFRCRFCDFHDTCWGSAPAAADTPAPSWITKVA